jgi:putative hemolysin
MKRVAGAYRLGRIDLILQKPQGIHGVYNASFFDFSPVLLQRLSQGIELGRAFICADYQRRTGALDTLWMGIGHFLHTHPQYRYLYGTVSISSCYTQASRTLILHYLQQHCMFEEAGCTATPHTPPRDLKMHRADIQLVKHACTDLALLAHAVKSMENNARALPVLLRQYLKLGGKMLAFNVDADFASVLDCLVIVDLQNLPERMKNRYLMR